MAFKMNGFSGFINKMRIKKAKKLIRKNVGNTTVDSPSFNEKKFDKSNKKVNKAVDLLRKSGKSEEEIEIATGVTGYKDAMDFATNKNKKK